MALRPLCWEEACESTRKPGRRGRTEKCRVGAQLPPLSKLLARSPRPLCRGPEPGQPSRAHPQFLAHAPWCHSDTRWCLQATECWGLLVTRQQGTVRDTAGTRVLCHRDDLKPSAPFGG